MDYILAPSILSADFKSSWRADEILQRIMVQNICILMSWMECSFQAFLFGMPVLKSIHNATDQVMDAHLMVQEPIVTWRLLKKQEPIS